MSDKEIIKVLDELGKRFGIIIDWSNQNIIPYLQELLKRFICYRNITACIWILTSILITITGIEIVKLLNKWRKSYDYDSYDDIVLITSGYICSIGIILLGIVLIIGNVIGICKNICTPEIVVYEYIKTLN